MLKLFQDGIKISVSTDKNEFVANFDHNGITNMAFSDGTAVRFENEKCNILQKGASYITIETDKERVGDVLFIGQDVKWMICGEYIGRGYKTPWL